MKETRLIPVGRGVAPPGAAGVEFTALFTCRFEWISVTFVQSIGVFAMVFRKLLHTIWMLFLACLNATLVLIALCLWLAWSLAGRIDDATANLAQSAEQIAPLRLSIENATGELARLRGDLASSNREAVSEAQGRLTAQVEQLSARLESVQGRLDSFGATPEEQTDHLIDSIADAVSTIILRTVTDIREVF